MLCAYLLPTSMIHIAKLNIALISQQEPRRTRTLFASDSSRTSYKVPVHAIPDHALAFTRTLSQCIRNSLVGGSALQCDASHSAQSGSSVPDRRLDRKGVGSPTSARSYMISQREVATSPRRTRRERRLPPGGLTIDGRLTPLYPLGTVTVAKSM